MATEVEILAKSLKLCVGVLGIVLKVFNQLFQFFGTGLKLRRGKKENLTPNDTE